MAQCFTSWTVLPHGSLERHSENLWSVSGTLPKSTTERRMVVARRSDGGLVIHNAVALEEPAMKELEAFGTPAVLLVPNGFHRQDAFIFKQRYPKLRVFAPQGALKKVSQVVAVDGSYAEAPQDSQVEILHLRGMKEREGVVRVNERSAPSLVFNDALLNLAPRSGLMGFVMQPTGTVSVPRVARWLLMKSGAELKAHLQELSAAPLERVLFGHGATVESGASAAVNAAAERLS